MVHSHNLKVGAGWSQQISAIRDAHSDDTNLIRFDNTFYRYARPGPPIEICVATSDGEAKVQLKVDPATFYMSPMTGRPIENYAPDLDTKVLSDESLNSAIREVAGGKGSSTVTSLLVFAVAESIRFDQLATDINSCFLADAGMLITTRLTNVDGQKMKGMRIGEWLRLIRCWGQASKAAIGNMPPDVAADVDSGQRHSDRFQRVVTTGDAELDACLRKMKLINRSTSRR